MCMSLQKEDAMSNCLEADHSRSKKIYFILILFKVAFTISVSSCFYFFEGGAAYANEKKQCDYEYYQVSLNGDILHIPKKYNPEFYLNRNVVRLYSRCEPVLDEVDKIILKPYKYSDKSDGGGLSIYGWNKERIDKEIARNYLDDIRIQITSHKNDSELNKKKEALSAPIKRGLNRCSKKINYIHDYSEFIFTPDKEGAYYVLDDALFRNIFKKNNIVIYYGCKPYFNVSKTNLGVGTTLKGYIFDYIRINAGGKSAYMPPGNWQILLNELKGLKLEKGEK